MPNWIMFYQKPPGSRIKYITDEMESASSMLYDKFLVFLQTTFKLKRYNELMEAIDSFQTVIAFKETGDWQIEEQEKPDVSKYSVQDLIKQNKNKSSLAQKKEEDGGDFFVNLEKKISGKKPIGRQMKWTNPFLLKKPLNWKFWN